jgi:acyl-CoA reductase-like NAD-dependent aldehyde dehydrogenase
MASSSISVREYPFLLGGRWVSEGDALEVRSPYDNSVVGQMFRATPAQAEAAVTAAVRAFEITRRMPAVERYRALRHVSDALTARRDEFARVLSLEAGKPIKTARAEVERAAFTFQVAAEEAERIGGEYLPLDLQESTTGRWGMVRRFPLGPVLAITPFNFPLNLVAHKLAPAMAAGCSVVLKPASKTPLSALALAGLIQEAGWPAGALNVLPLSNQDAEPLVRDDRLKLLSFTGSGAVGWRLKSQAGKKRVGLELGGNAGCIVHRDADLKYAAERCAVGGFSYAGQSCISVQRILVEQSVLPAFLDLFVPMVQKLKLGDPLEETTDVGPMVQESEAVRAESWVKEAVAGGARLLCGGARRGALLEPAVLTRTTPAMKVNCEEIFAPVVTVEPYDDFDAALIRVNDSPYGLQAGVFTNDARLIFRAYEELEVGGVIIGDVPTSRIDHMPYGGVKDSGNAREGLKYAIEEMTERKLLVMNLR